MILTRVIDRSLKNCEFQAQVTLLCARLRQDCDRMWGNVDDLASSLNVAYSS
jgi:hypothetical protein